MALSMLGLLVCKESCQHWDCYVGAEIQVPVFMHAQQSTQISEISLLLLLVLTDEQYWLIKEFHLLCHLNLIAMVTNGLQCRSWDWSSGSQASTFPSEPSDQILHQAFLISSFSDSNRAGSFYSLTILNKDYLSIMEKLLTSKWNVSNKFQFIRENPHISRYSRKFWWGFPQISL